MTKNIFYFYYINAIGGVESMFYYLAKKYKDKDIVIYYSQGDQQQINRLKQFVEVKQYKGEIIQCEKAFFNYNISIIDNIKAKEYCLLIHADYKAMGLQPITHPKINRYIAVSELAKQSYEELSGKKCEVCYNPIMLDPPKKTLKLISATRLTKEKGKDRMIKLGKLFNNNNIPYQWTIFTNDRFPIKNSNIIYKKPVLNITDYIAESDYLVQLSDCESYCYSIVEALMLGIPVICTHCPVFDEIGLKEGENCYYCDFNMENVPIDKIYNNIPKVNYKAKEDNWNNILAPGESEYHKKLNTKVKVKATDLYVQTRTEDCELHKIPKRGEIWKTSLYRYEYLNQLGYVTLVAES